MIEIEKLGLAKDSARKAWLPIQTQADAASRKYAQAAQAHREAVLYEKIKRQVIRDLIKSCGAGQPEES